MSGNTVFASANPLSVLKPKKEPRRYTLQEYLDREENASELHEYYDGIITKLPMARTPHNIISANMTAELIFAVRQLDKKYIVMSNQQLVYLPKLNFSLYPDVLVIGEKSKHQDNNQVLLLNPIIIVEVLSRSTGKYDRTQKFEEYKTLDSFREYILINQKKCSVQTRYKEEPNLWRDENYTELSDKIVLKSIGCEIELSKIYENIEF